VVTRQVAELGVGGAFKDARHSGSWGIGATAFGEMLPNHANQVSIDTAEGQGGLPVLAIDCATARTSA